MVLGGRLGRVALSGFDEFLQSAAATLGAIGLAHKSRIQRFRALYKNLIAFLDDFSLILDLERAAVLASS